MVTSLLQYTHANKAYCALHQYIVRLRLKCDITRAETRFRLSAKWTSPFKSTGASVQSTTGSRGVRISSSNGSNLYNSLPHNEDTERIYTHNDYTLQLHPP